MTPIEIEIMREIDCPEKPWSERKPKKKPAREATQADEGDDTMSK